MKEQGKNVLLGKLKDWRWAVQHGHTKRRDFRNWHDDDEQAYQEICQLIENQPEVTRKFVEKWFDKINYGIPVGFTVPITYLIAFLKEAGVEIREEGNGKYGE